MVYRLKGDFPYLKIILNGGLTRLEQVALHLSELDGVMIGRAAYHNPYLLAEVDQRFFGALAPPPSRRQVAERFLPYVEGQLAQGVPLTHMTRHILGLFQGQPGARTWRRQLSENAHCQGAGVEVIENALGHVLDLA
jgi:tRNA-dihydrouridine synthase A